MACLSASTLHTLEAPPRAAYSEHRADAGTVVALVEEETGLLPPDHVRLERQAVFLKPNGIRELVGFGREDDRGLGKESPDDRAVFQRAGEPDDAVFEFGIRGEKRVRDVARPRRERLAVELDDERVGVAVGDQPGETVAFAVGQPVRRGLVRSYAGTERGSLRRELGKERGADRRLCRVLLQNAHAERGMRVPQPGGEDLFPVRIVQHGHVAGRGVGRRFLYGILEQPRMPRTDGRYGLLLHADGNAARFGSAGQGVWSSDEHDGRM